MISGSRVSGRTTFAWREDVFSGPLTVRATRRVGRTRLWGAQVQAHPEYATHAGYRESIDGYLKLVLANQCRTTKGLGWFPRRRAWRALGGRRKGWEKQ
jgi:hypothetical protein